MAVEHKWQKSLNETSPLSEEELVLAGGRKSRSTTTEDLSVKTGRVSPGANEWHLHLASPLLLSPWVCVRIWNFDSRHALAKSHWGSPQWNYSLQTKEKKNSPFSVFIIFYFSIQSSSLMLIEACEELLVAPFVELRFTLQADSRPLLWRFLALFPSSSNAAKLSRCLVQ